MNKNTVFALKSFRKSSNDFTHDGYLLFPNETKADSFLGMCEVMNLKVKTCHYEKDEHVEVNDFVANKVNTQVNFYVKMLEQHQLA